eukprot:586549_1
MAAKLEDSVIEIGSSNVWKFKRELTEMKRTLVDMEEDIWDLECAIDEADDEAHKQKLLKKLQFKQKKVRDQKDLVAGALKELHQTEERMKEMKKKKKKNR